MVNVVAYCRVLLTITALCCGTILSAQTSPEYSYEFFNSAHGLPSTEIIALAKDNKGFLWIGTAAGISRYDGYEFHNYNRSNEGEILGYVNTLATDRNDNIWIGTGAGLFRLTNNEIIRISAPSNLPQGVNEIFPESDGTLWLATENGPVKISSNDLPAKIQLENYILPQWDFRNKTYESRRLDHIRRAADGTVYFSDLVRLFVLKENRIDLLHTITKDRDHILALFPVDKSTIFFTASETEIHKVENGMHTNIHHKILYRPGVDDALAGDWYLGTFGLYYFHPQTGVASRYINTMKNGVEWAVTMLKDNNFFWVATHYGLVKVKPYQFSTYNTSTIFPYHNDYYSFLQLKNGKLLIGGNRGTIVERGEAGFTILQHHMVPMAEIKCLYEDEWGTLWAGTGYQGLVRLRNQQVTKFTQDDGLHDNSFSQFLKTSRGKLLVIGDHGLSEIIAGENGTVSFKKYVVGSNISRHAKFYSAIETPSGKIIIGGEEGLFILADEQLRPLLVDRKVQPVKSITSDGNGNVWIASDGEGILQCAFGDKDELVVVKQFTKSDGLNTLHYLALLADSENNVWAGSSIGLTFIGQGKYIGKILNFDQSDGFTKPGYNSIVLYQEKDKTIWAGTTYGFISFKPGASLLSSAPPRVYFAGIKQIKKNGLLADETASRNYAYDNNSFNFNYSALDYANQAGLQYFYKLEGLDTNWIPAGNLRSVTYENLTPRKYAFHVKALNNKGKWSEQDAVWSFSIAAPFWKQSWFAILSAVAFVGLLIFLIRKIEARQAVLQKQKAARYREQLEIEQIINHFATSMHSISNTDDLLWDVAKNCISKLNFEDCVIYLKDGNELIQKAALGPKTSRDTIVDPVVIPVGKGITGHVALTGNAEIVSDTSLDERYIVDDERRHAEIAVPIIANESVIGVIDSEHSQKNFYTERHLQILTTIASLCATKIDTFRAEQQAIEKEMEVLRLNKDFATSQLTALRMQMNPHFIFNALNSIQHYILQGNVVEANKFLSKFSKLQRDILHCSSQQFIALEKELEILNAYLQLEQYRFGGNFTYKINMTEEIEPVEIMIPPMILQPFVENSIWHGLMPLQTDRVLSIYFELESEDILLACLRDNGIGRAASAKLKQGDGQIKKDHESKGMSMVHQRLQLLQQQYDKPFAAAISDITDVQGNVMGTQVEIKIFIGNKKV